MAIHAGGLINTAISPLRETDTVNGASAYTLEAANPLESISAPDHLRERHVVHDFTPRVDFGVIEVIL